MVLLVAGVLIIGVTFAVSQVGGKNTNTETQRVSKTTGVPNEVKSTPGAQVTPNYAQLQQQANARGSQEAAKKGTTFIPTLTGSTAGYSDADFEKQLSNAYDTLGGKCTKEKVAELNKEGMNTTQIIMQLKSYGCSAAAIASLFSPDQIAAALLAEKACAAGANAAGCTADTVKQMRAGGLNASQIVGAMKKNGCAIDDIVAALKANGSTIDEITQALKDNGSDASEIAAALTKAGFSKNDVMAALTNAGFAAVDIAKAMSAINLAQAQNSSALSQQQAQSATAQRLAAQQEAQQLAAYSQQMQGKIQDLVTAMDGESKNALQVWGQTPQQLYTQGEWASKKAAEEKAAGKAGSSKSGSKGSNSAKNGKTILKAGSILFAVLDTAVDSDEPGPVMATIVGGTLKGAKLLGTMQTNTDSETLSLNFTAINLPDEANSMGISAVAIDPDTARTALSTNVDHHYLYRWGSLLASSFVQGYASSVASSGTTSTTSQGAAGVTTTTSSPQTNSKQQLWSGIAAVGTKWSQVVGQNFERPVTITIAQGTGLGILVTSDMVYGTNPIYYTPPSQTTTAASGTGAGGAGGSGSTSSTVVGLPGSNTGTNPTAGGSTAGVATGPAGLTNDQRQALLNLLQNQPAAAPGQTQQLQPGSSVYVTGGAAQ
jgi:type IV secretory pathway VirB10-like protein